MVIGNIYAAKARFDSCIFFYQAALQKLTIAGDSSSALVLESNLSIVYKNIGLYEESLASALHVISSQKTTDQSLLRGSCYNTIGSLYTRTRDYDKALEYYRLALENRKVNNQSADVARIYNNIGEVFITMKQYDSAVTNLQKAAAIKRELNDIKGLSRTINNIGQVSLLTGNTSLADKQLNEALAMQNQIDDPVGMIQLLNNLGELNLRNNQVLLAQRNLKRSESIIHRAGTPDYLQQNLELQIRLDREQRNFANGMNHLEQLIAVRNSLFNEEKNRSLQAMQIRYETLKKEQQIAILEQREEINRNRIRSSQTLIGTLGVGLLLVTGVGLIAYVNFRSARASKERFELLLADFRHRAKNNFQTLASIFHLQARHYTDHNMILEARSSESRVHAMSLLHEKFYSVSPGQAIELRKYTNDLVNQLTDIYNFRTKNLSLVVDIDDVNLDIDKALPLSLIVQELVSNSFKYAFTNISDPHLEVSMKLQPDGDLLTIVCDNGVGIDIHLRHTSQGFDLVEAFVDQLHGKLDVKSNNGTTVTIKFPTTPSWKRHSS
ncbi:MAG TPA: tetratricopeptide repeat protein [Cyclobacteriaceae bacterium]|nr:tetratricopeptide repeat protein [Cyclobacteriaceae bacterium]